MMALCTLCAATFISASPLVHAQAPKSEGARFDCSQAKDPKACEERRDKMKAARSQAEQACQGKARAEHRECMVQQMCAQSKDPKGCEEHMSKAKETAKGARAACDGRRGAERDARMVKQMCESSTARGKC